MTRHVLARRALWLFLVLLGACSPLRDNDAMPGAEGDGCGEDPDCGPGLVCAADALCAPVGDPGTGDRDDTCLADPDCRYGLVCNGLGVCDRPRSGGIGASCVDDSSCAGALVCDRDRACADLGDPGTLGLNELCEEDEACRFGLVCSARQLCAEPTWSGVTCGDAVVEGEPRVLFEVPRGGAPTDFFRLPYPNDVRSHHGVLDLGDFPGLDAAPADLLSRYAAAIAQDGHGFGPNSAVFFRMSTPLDYDTLSFGGDASNFYFVDVTQGVEGIQRPRARFFATTQRARYICHNWLSIRPSEGSPLQSGHTYAVFFRRGLTDTHGVPFEADADFAIAMGDVPPEHPALAAAWSAYRPLRAWLATHEIPVGDVIGGTVFTVGEPRTEVASVHEQVQLAPAPSVDEPVLCGTGTSSCGVGVPRGCGPIDEGFSEIHAKLTLPVFVEGVAPFSAWGGGIVTDGRTPKLQRLEEVCLAVTVPSGPAPAGGWPILLYSHDMGGHFRSFIERGLAAQMAELGWAVASVDAPLHGLRFDGTAAPLPTVSSDLLLDMSRPALMRGQAIQGAADLFALARFFKTAELPVAGGRTRFSNTHLAVMGHGWGGAASTLFAAYQPDLEAAVFSGTGAGLIDQFRVTQAPTNTAATLEEGLADTEFNGMHPALHLLQTYLDGHDPVNYGGLLRQPPEGVGGVHLFVLHGVDDETIPTSALAHHAVSTRAPRIGAELQRLDGVIESTEPSVRGNVRLPAGRRTHGIKQYASDGSYPAHDVAFHNGTAQADLAAFFAGLLADPDGLPTISP